MRHGLLHVTILAATLTLLSPIGSAQALTVSRERVKGSQSYQVKVLADPGATSVNRTWIASVRDDNTIFVSDSQPMRFGTGCARVWSQAAVCPAQFVTDVLVQLGPGSDTLYDTIPSAQLQIPLTVHGGPGNDVIYGQNGPDWLYGERGQDELIGNGGGDRLFGGTQFDKLRGGTRSNADDRSPAGVSLADLLDCGGDYDIAYSFGPDLVLPNCEARG